MSVQLAALVALTPRGTAAGTHSIEYRVGTKAGLDGVENIYVSSLHCPVIELLFLGPPVSSNHTMTEL